MAAGFCRKLSWACILGLHSHPEEAVIVDPASDTRWTEDVLGQTIRAATTLLGCLHSQCWGIPRSRATCRGEALLLIRVGQGLEREILVLPCA